ncbi:MAG: protein kinase [Acidobacteriota bacterium]
MTPEEWQEIDALVQAAFEVEPGERATFIDRACEGRPGLRREVAALLDADSRADSFLDQPARGPAPGHFPGEPGRSARPQPGSQVGPYRLIEEVGYGGFCRVYRAERTGGEFHQQVAVKIVDPGLDFGFGDDTGGDIGRRFRQERSIVAQLEHPSIARLLDGGEADGRPYFVMEFVDGEPIDRYCEARDFDLADRIRLMLKVIDAVDYAHGRLIVHRDLKPANLMVSVDGTPKLLDFGIAKVLEPEALSLSAHATRTGLRPMTPAWAAPEQVRGGAITTATDVYALGLLLYAVLTGERAYELGEMSPAAMEVLICDVDPPPPSERLDANPAWPISASSVRGDLDAIVGKALRKEPGHRYRSVRELGADLERFLADRPVAARPTTRSYRVGKWIRRHRWAVAAAVAAVTVVAAFIGVLMDQAKRLELERDAARQASSRAEEVSRFLVDIFAEADPGRTQGRDLSVHRILAEGESKIERLQEPAARTELLATLGAVHAGLGDVPSGAELLRRARAEAVDLYGAEHVRVADIDHQLGDLLLQSDRFDAAEAAIRSALDLRTRLLGDEAPETATARVLWGQLRLYLGYRDEADEILSRALADLDSAGSGHEAAQLDALDGLAAVRWRGGPEATRPFFERRLALARATYGEDHPEVADVLLDLAAYHPDPEQSRLTFERVKKLLDRLFEPDHPQHARYSMALSRRLLSSDPERALDLVERSYTINSRVWGEGTWTISLDHAGLALAHEALGHIDDADRHWRLAVENARQGTPVTHIWRTQSLVYRILFLLRADKNQETLALLDELVEIRAGMPHAEARYDSYPPALRAVAEVRLGVPGAADRLRTHGAEALEAGGGQGPIVAVIKDGLEALSAADQDPTFTEPMKASDS